MLRSDTWRLSMHAPNYIGMQMQDIHNARMLFQCYSSLYRLIIKTCFAHICNQTVGNNPIASQCFTVKVYVNVFFFEMCVMIAAFLSSGIPSNRHDDGDDRCCQYIRPLLYQL